MSAATRTALVTSFVPALASTAGASPVEAIVALIERAAPGGVVLDRSVPAPLVAPLVARLRRSASALPLLAVDGSLGSDARAPWLCAPDRDERQAAEREAAALIEQAAEVGAPLVVLALGELESLRGHFLAARDRFLRGELDAAAVQRWLAARTDEGAAALDRCLGLLERLLRRAEAVGTTLLLRSGRRYLALPSPRELDLLTGALAGAPLAPLLDVAAAHLLDVMGFVPLALSVAAFGSGPLCYFGDACGPIGALGPGRGIVALDEVRAALPAACRRAFRPWVGLSEEEVVEAVARLDQG